jgi:NAD(P)-dependent dehydrogenase (short-subunit alcohol dehydrogenase family)
MDCNLKAIFILSKFFVPFLQKTSGSIVNIASVHSIASSENIATYAASKAGLIGLTRNMAIEFSKLGIRVNALSPGAVDTKMLRDGLIRNITNPTDDMLLEALDKLGKKHLCNRVGNSLEIAKAIYFLSDNNYSSFIYGTNLIIDGGATIKLSTE